MLISLFVNSENKKLAFIQVIAYALAALIAIVLHELGHGYVSYRQGDDTAKLQGRLTLNPFAHLDLVGTLMMLFVGFGWAKPVPINPLNFREYKRGMQKVSLAGVAANLILGISGIALFALYALVLRSVANTNPILLSDTTQTLYYLLYLPMYFLIFLVNINFILMVFNLIPIYPLDGFRVLETLTKPNNKYIEFNYKYGNYTLLGFLLINFLCDRVFNVSLLSWVSNLVSNVLDLILNGIVR